MVSEPDVLSPLAPLASYPPHPDRRQSRAPEFYGFVAWSSTYFLFALYVLWALLPPDWIEAAGISWYPNREWAVLLPAYSVILILLTYFTYWALAFFNTPAFDDFSAITDGHAYVASSEDLFANASEAIPTPYDIPIGIINTALYHRDPKNEVM